MERSELSRLSPVNFSMLLIRFTKSNQQSRENYRRLKNFKMWLRV